MDLNARSMLVRGEYKNKVTQIFSTYERRLSYATCKLMQNKQFNVLQKGLVFPFE